MRILEYEMPDKLVCKYAHEITGLGFARIEAHRAIYKYLARHYSVFKKYFKGEKDFVACYEQMKLDGIRPMLETL